MTILATRSLVDQAECGFHLIACTSNTLKRVCRSTLTAETYQMELGVEAADQLRATIVDMFVPLSRKQWEIEATSAIHDGKTVRQASGHHDCVSSTGNLETQR